MTLITKMRYHLVDSTTLLQTENKAVLKFGEKEVQLLHTHRKLFE
jgi:hypothetical protein